MTTIQAINNWTPKLEKALVDSYIKEGLKASGRWEKSLHTTVLTTATGYKITSYAANHHEYMVNGRHPNKKKTDAEILKFAKWAGSTFIKDWVRDKGLNLNPYAVAYNIGKNGFNPRAADFVEKAITPSLLSDLTKAAASDITNINFVKQWQ
jgi:hypothetical protein